MNPKIYNISTPKTARYYIIGEQSDKINSVWIVLHGFKQLAELFVKYFRILLDENTLIVAPEALNKFYIEGFNGKVGATWMTKEDRENEIKDYVNYLDLVYDEVIISSVFSKAKVNVLGFSQGTVTALRWLVNGKSKINRAIIWGGGIPKEIDLPQNKELFNSSDFTIVVGYEDEFVASAQLNEELNALDDNNINYKIIRYKGGHEIKPEILKHLK